MEFDINNKCWKECKKCKKVYWNKLNYKYHVCGQPSKKGNYNCVCGKHYITLAGFVYHRVLRCALY